MAPLTILIPAAGASSRMRGGDKLLEPVADEILLHRQARIALPLGLVTVTLRGPDPQRRAALDGLAVTVLGLGDAGLGMSASFRAMAGCGTAVMVLPGDMPDLTAQDLADMARAHHLTPNLILRGSAGQTPGHPVIWPADLVPQFASLTGDQGARSLLTLHAGRVRLHPLPGQNALTDLDTPEDWAAWRAAQAASNTRTS